MWIKVFSSTSGGSLIRTSIPKNNLMIKAVSIFVFNNLSNLFLNMYSREILREFHKETLWGDNSSCVSTFTRVWGNALIHLWGKGMSQRGGHTIWNSTRIRSNGLDEPSNMAGSSNDFTVILIEKRKKMRSISQ